MTFSYRKTAAAAAAIVCAAALCGCSDSGYVMTVEGEQIRNGIYLSLMQTAYSDASGEISDEKTENGDTSEIGDVFGYTIEDKSASDWIKENTLEQVKNFVAVKRLCEKYGITLTNEELNEINSSISSLWNDENYYAQYLYKTDTIGEYYDSIGIGRDSLTEIYKVNSLSDKLFLYYYDTDGLTPVSDEDFDAYLKENYAGVKYIELEFDDYAGISLKEEADIQAVRDTAQSYADRLNSGESFIDIKYDYDLQQAQNKARADAEDNYDSTSTELTLEEYVQQAVDAATAEKAESESSLERVISKSSSSLDADITDYIWSIADDSKASLFETEDSVYVVVRDDMTKLTEWKETNRSSVLKAMKSDEYNETLKNTYADYSVELNDYLVNNKYAPEKVKGLG